MTPTIAIATIIRMTTMTLTLAIATTPNNDNRHHQPSSIIVTIIHHHQPSSFIFSIAHHHPSSSRVIIIHHPSSLNIIIVYIYIYIHHHLSSQFNTIHPSINIHHPHKTTGLRNLVDLKGCRTNLLMCWQSHCLDGRGLLMASLKSL